MDYSKEKGIVGKWKGYPVYITNTKEYGSLPAADDTIYVLADDKMTMVQNGIVIGYLSASGSVSQSNSCRPYFYEKPKPVMAKAAEVKGAVAETQTVEVGDKEIKLEVSIPSGYFDIYAETVNRFFEELKAE